MKLSTRSRYGMRMMYEMALAFGKGFIYLKDISASQDISEKYLGQLVIPLRTAGLVNSSRGIHGGYALSRHPSKITLYDIISVLEGSYTVVDCINDDELCGRSKKCPTRWVWDKLNMTIVNFLKGITLEDLTVNGSVDSEQGTYHI